MRHRKLCEFRMFFRRIVSFGVLLLLQGCAAVPTADGERLELASPEFRAYVERVFREQNRVADAVAFALEEEDSDAGLAAAEQRLLAACAGVNELATARRDDSALGLRRSLRAARTVPECERAARLADAELARAAR
jgi:hypothetical protein